MSLLHDWWLTPLKVNMLIQEDVAVFWSTPVKTFL